MYKKVYLLPLSLISVVLFSCNNSWPTITDDEAIKRVQAIYDYQKTLPNLNTIRTSDKYEINYETEGLYLTNSYVYVVEADITNNYMKEVETNKTTSTSSKVTTYHIKKDNVYYVCTDDNATKTKKTVTETEFKSALDKRVKVTNINERSITRFSMDNFKEFIDEIKAIQEELKESKEEFDHYTITSDAEKNIHIKENSRLYADNKEYLVTDTVQTVFRDAICTYFGLESSYTKDKTAVSLYDENKNEINPQIKQDSINLDEYKG